jgi:hypothetical protein
VPFNTFTITQVTYDFTATVSSSITTALQTTSTSVLVSSTQSQILVTNAVAPVTVTGVGFGGYNQSLNTTDNVTFNAITTRYIYGYAQLPVEFPNGLIANQFNSLDFINTNDP